MPCKAGRRWTSRLALPALQRLGGTQGKTRKLTTTTDPLQHQSAEDAPLVPAGSQQFLALRLLVSHHERP